MMNEPTCFIVEESDTYHGKAKNFLSSHQLSDFRKCPQLYHQKREGIIQAKDSSAYAFGRAAHTLILEGIAVFEREYAVGGPINEKTGKSYGRTTKKFAEWLDGSGKTDIVTEQEMDVLRKMMKSIAGHELASDLLREGLAERVVRDRYCETDCQIRMDFFNDKKQLVDFKTCDDLSFFEHDARRYGYIFQLAFYRAVLKVALGIDCEVFMVAVEKKEPHRCGVWRIADEFLNFAEQENQMAISRLLMCSQRGEFPTGFEQVRILDMSNWRK